MVGGTTNLTSITTDSGGTVSIGGNVTTTGAQTYNDAMTLTAATVFSASAFTTSSTLSASSYALTITTDAIALGGNVSGSGALIIQPKTDTITIAIGSDASGTLKLDDTELGYLRDGFSSITIGSTTATGAIAINYASAYTFTDPITIRKSTGSGSAITLTDEFTSGNLTLASNSIVLNNNVTTSGTQTYTGAVTLGTSIALASTAAASSGNSISFSSTINGTSANTESLTLNSGSSGTISVGSAVGGSVTLKTMTITNSGGATAEELIQLARDVRASVEQKFGITLEPEVNLVGLAL